MKMTLRFVALCVVGVLSLQAIVLLALGQPLISLSGFVTFWISDPVGPEISQHLTDWYSLSHVIHGFIFYFLATLLFPRLSFGTRLFIAVGVEVGWELLENTPMIIERYRQTALAQGYIGDSVINSLSDTIAMVLGFFAAWRLPLWASVAAVVGLEALPLFIIRDSLVLNVLNLLWPIEIIQNWQSGG